MLSKLRYFFPNSDKNIEEPGQEVDLRPIAQELGIEKDSIKPVHGGTLGSCYIAQRDECSLFLKTHALALGRANLIKEGAILKALYARRINIQQFEVPESIGSRYWLVMDLLSKPQLAIEPGHILRICRNYRPVLQDAMIVQKVPQTDNILTLLAYGNAVLWDLADRNVVDSVLVQSLNTEFRRLEEGAKRFPPCVCHGDLGPENIMKDSLGQIVIDWEDAFWGIPGYDYLCWLTFMQNRKYYSETLLGCTPLGRDLETAILSLVIVLKSGLGLWSGEYVHYQMPIQARLEEVFSIH